MSTISVRKPPPVQQDTYMVPKDLCCSEMKRWVGGIGFIFGYAPDGGISWDSTKGEIVVSRRYDYAAGLTDRFMKAELSYCPFCGEKLEYVRES